MWVEYGSIKVPFLRQALRSSLAITSLSSREILEVLDAVESRIRRMGSVVTVEHLKKIVYDLLSAYGEEGRYEVWEMYRALRKGGKYEKPIIFSLSGPSTSGKSLVANELLWRFVITRYLSTDTIRQMVRISSPKPTVMVHTWEAWQYLSKEDFERITSEYKVRDKALIGYIDQALWVVEKGVRPVVERINLEGANALIEGVHLLPGSLEGENIIFVVLEVPEKVHRSFVLFRGVRKELNDVAHSLEKREKEYVLIRKVHDFLIREAKRYDIPVVPSYPIEEAARRIVDIAYERVKEIVEQF